MEFGLKLKNIFLINGYWLCFQGKTSDEPESSPKISAQYIHLFDIEVVPFPVRTNQEHPTANSKYVYDYWKKYIFHISC